MLLTGAVLIVNPAKINRGTIIQLFTCEQVRASSSAVVAVDVRRPGCMNVNNVVGPMKVILKDVLGEDNFAGNLLGILVLIGLMIGGLLFSLKVIVESSSIVEKHMNKLVEANRNAVKTWWCVRWVDKLAFPDLTTENVSVGQLVSTSGQPRNRSQQGCYFQALWLFFRSFLCWCVTNTVKWTLCVDVLFHDLLFRGLLKY